MRDVLHTAVSRACTSPPCSIEEIVRIFDGNEESHVVLMCITIVKERKKNIPSTSEHIYSGVRTYLDKRGSGVRVITQTAKPCIQDSRQELVQVAEQVENQWKCVSKSNFCLVLPLQNIFGEKRNVNPSGIRSSSSVSFGLARF